MGWLRNIVSSKSARLRLLASIPILALLWIVAILPTTSLGRRGSEARARADVTPAIAIGEPLPALALQDLDGNPYRLEALRGKRVLLTFERSVDW
jgi:cytochrome oxidase Cu insertion factor (SCO1/SenC/PrrC family)